MDIRIFPPEEIIEGEVNLPVSKSYLNRNMIMDKIAGDELPEIGSTECGTDIQTLHRALSEPLTGIVDIGDAGTAMRFLTALCAAMPDTEVCLCGADRMSQRPIGPLVDALRSCGADISYAAREGFPPLNIRGKQLIASRVIEMNASVSSQFISALLMIAPMMKGGLSIDLEGPVISRPYIALTIDMMRRRRINVDVSGTLITVGEGDYSRNDGEPELDWSALAFWAELVSVTAGFITIPGLDRNSSQGDVRVLDLFAQLGVATDSYDDDSDVCTGNVIQLCGSPEVSPRLNYDFTESPDLVQPAVVACCLIGVPFHFTGLETLAIKETDRVAALIEEMAKIGIILSSEHHGDLHWEGARRPVGDLPEFDSHGDHRMAMSLAAVAAFIPGIVIRGAECVDKSYPRFWEELTRLGFRIIDAAQPFEIEESD